MCFDETHLEYQITFVCQSTLIILLKPVFQIRNAFKHGRQKKKPIIEKLVKLKLDETLSYEVCFGFLHLTLLMLLFLR